MKKDKEKIKTTKALSSKLIKWYRKEARDLPWRRTQDPYHIWVSEIILQQTTVAQGEAYYHRFLKKFPTISILASATQDDVLKLWEGLGYYSRARNLHAASQDVMERFDGKFPDTYEDIISLKGIGPYAAAAIGSFVYGIPKVVVDGNVLRVISRLYGIEEAVDLPATKKIITHKAQVLLETQDPAEFNQTIMEFGAMQCTYKSPGCADCPLRKYCVAYDKELVTTLPLKSKKIKKRKRFFQYALISDKKDNYLIEQRQQKDVWQGLHQFPLVETPKKANALSLHDIPDLGSVDGELETVSDNYKQTLTHQYIHAVFYHFKSAKLLKQEKHKNRMVVSLAKFKELTWPKVIANYLTDRELL